MKRKLGVRVSNENEYELKNSGRAFAAAKKIQRSMKSAFLVEHTRQGCDHDVPGLWYRGRRSSRSQHLLVSFLE
jgi:hypothetical protein